MSHTVLRVPESALLAGYVAALERQQPPPALGKGVVRRYRFRLD